MVKRGQSESSSAYIILVIVLAAIVVIGFESIFSMSNSADKVKTTAFSSRISADVETLSNEYGSVREFSYNVPTKFGKVCFLDYNADPSGIGSFDLRLYPLIRNSYISGTGKNLFLVGDSIESYNLAGLELGKNTTFACLPTADGKLDLKLKGTKTGAFLLRETVASTQIPARAAATLNFGNGDSTLDIPEGTFDSSATVTVQEVVVPDLFPENMLVTPIYHFEVDPPGTPFLHEVSVTLPYHPELLGLDDDCHPDPDKLRLYHYTHLGFVSVQYYAIDCGAHTASFYLDSFSDLALVYAFNSQVDLAAFDDSLLKASGNLLFGGNLLTLAEIQDLFYARDHNVANNMIDLGGTGDASHENLLYIYNKASAAQ